MADAKPRVLLIVTQDTKEREGQFLRDCLEDAGCQVVHLDPSVRRIVGSAEIGPEHVAQAAGLTLEQIRAIGHEGKIQERMIAGSIALALAENRNEPFAGILSIGGSMGTTLGTAVMRAFPYGIPKIMISTLASGFTAPFVGSHDITLVNAVCDIAGINSITADIYRNAAYGLAGATRAWHAQRDETRPLILMSTLGTTEAAARTIRERLEASGHEVMVFHSTGAGGQTLDSLAGDPRVRAVVDLSLVEINDHLHGGICSAGADRGMAAIRAGVPVVFAPGNCDFYIMPSPAAAGDNPFGGRRFHIHNAALTAVRTTAADLERLADHVAQMAGQARAAVAFVVPLGGFSSHDSREGHLHDPAIPPVFADYARAAMPDHVDVQVIDAHINDAAFADAVVDTVLRVARAGEPA